MAGLLAHKLPVSSPRWLHHHHHQQQQQAHAHQRLSNSREMLHLAA
jgi:hypothetical protein